MTVFDQATEYVKHLVITGIATAITNDFIYEPELDCVVAIRDSVIYDADWIESLHLKRLAVLSFLHRAFGLRNRGCLYVLDVNYGRKRFTEYVDAIVADGVSAASDSGMFANAPVISVEELNEGVGRESAKWHACYRLQCELGRAGGGVAGGLVRDDFQMLAEMDRQEFAMANASRVDDYYKVIRNNLHIHVSEQALRTALFRSIREQLSV